MRRAFGVLFVVLTAGGVVTALTALYLSIHTLMNSSCGSVDSEGMVRSCPAGVAGLLPGAIWGSLIFSGLYVLVTVKFKVPSLVSLIWPALFLSLAYTFFDYGVNGGSSPGGWIVLGVVFALMGVVPLFWAVPHLWRVYVHGRDDDPKPWHVSTTGAAMGGAVSAMKLLDRLGKTPNRDMTESLERLDELHKSGALDDLEYAKAKDRVIRGENA